MDPVDPKRRGRRLFGGRRRHEHAAEAEMDQTTTTTVPDAEAPDEPLEMTADPTEAAALDVAPPPVDTPDPSEPSPDEPRVISSEPTVEPEVEPEVEAESDAAADATDTVDLDQARTV